VEEKKNQKSGALWPYQGEKCREKKKPSSGLVKGNAVDIRERIRPKNITPAARQSASPCGGTHKGKGKISPKKKKILGPEKSRGRIVGG